jgi:hypothetical protein
MNECPKCAGLLIAERDLLLGESIRCLNCGCGGGAMPRFKTEEGKQRWLASMAARRGKTLKKKTAAIELDGSVSMKRNGSGAGIAGALEEIESKITALEQVKRNLLQAQQLVNL